MDTGGFVVGFEVDFVDDVTTVEEMGLGVVVGLHGAVTVTVTVK